MQEQQQQQSAAEAAVDVEEQHVAGDGGKLLTVEQILAADDRKVLDVDIEEWGGTMRFKQMSAQQALDFAQLAGDPAKRQQAMVRIMFETAIDENGGRLFTEEAHLAGLLDRNVKVFIRLQSILLDFNGLGDAEEAVDQEKND